MARNGSFSGNFGVGQAVEFTSTAKRGRPAEVILGQLEKLHYCRSLPWWEVSTADGRNWRVPERMLRQPSKPVSKAKLAKGVADARDQKQRVAEAKSTRRAAVASKIQARGAFDKLRVGGWVYYRGEKRRVAALMPQLGKVSLEVADTPQRQLRSMIRHELGRRVVTRTAVWAHWVTPVSDAK